MTTQRIARLRNLADRSVSSTMVMTDAQCRDLDAATTLTTMVLEVERHSGMQDWTDYANFARNWGPTAVRPA